MHNSFLDSDLYKLTQMQAVGEHYPNTKVTYQFIDRDRTILENPDRFLGRFIDRLAEISDRKITPEELDYLRSLGYFKEPYLEKLAKLKLDYQDINVSIIKGRLEVDISEADWFDTIYWEVPLLSAATETYLEHSSPANIEHQLERLLNKRDEMGKLAFCEFGTRRRRNFAFQDLAVKVLKAAPGFLGTSNTYLAKKYNVKNVGTIAHEFFSGTSAFVGVENANKVALKNWLTTYQDSLAIALPDTFTTDVFLRSFDRTLANAYVGTRQDSGSPTDFAQKMLDHYHILEIDPSTKNILFSDGLTPKKCHDINNALASNPIQKLFAIGTDFSNNQKLNIVMKLTKVNGVDVVKLSDTNGKEVGSSTAIINVKSILGIS